MRERCTWAERERCGCIHGEYECERDAYVPVVHLHALSVGVCAVCAIEHVAALSIFPGIGGMFPVIIRQQQHHCVFRYVINTV